MTTYITGKKIETETAEFTTARGAKVEITILKNARLGQNGDWLSAATHEIALRVNGNMMSYCGAEHTAAHGYAIFADMRKSTIPVPAEHQAAVQTLIESRQAHNQAIHAMNEQARAEYDSHVAAVYKMMDA